MTCVYAVRCNFARPDLEAAWNAWYSGPKLAQMLTKPLFLSGQRFKASRLNCCRQYLALWIVESPAAFETREYREDWGFFEWQPHILDWSRDLYQAPAVDMTAGFAIDGTHALYLAAFEDQSPEAAERLRRQAAPRRPGVTWMTAIGLDKHSPIIGLERLPRGARPSSLGIEGVQETLFEPISACALGNAQRPGH
jgi:hypothetical protein